MYKKEAFSINLMQNTNRNKFFRENPFLSYTLLVVLVFVVGCCFHVDFVSESCTVRLFGIGIHVCVMLLCVIHTFQPPFGNRLWAVLSTYDHSMYRKCENYTYMQKFFEMC